MQLKRRHDVVPNLVEVVRSYAQFEKHLLEVENEWAAQFSGVLERAAQGQGGNGYRPGWYSGTALSRFGGAQFGSALTSSLASTIASSSTPPGSSSGSSGGGSSGGGGCGGGGGGW